MLSKTGASKQQLPGMAAETHFYTKRSGLSTPHLKLH